MTNEEFWSALDEERGRLREERDRYRAALESIRSIPQQYSLACDGANTAVEIARNALRDFGPVIPDPGCTCSDYR